MRGLIAKATAWLTGTATDERIIGAIDPWMLGCSLGVGSDHPHWSRSSLTFDTWFLCCEDTWVSKKAKELGVSIARIKTALVNFRSQNAGRDYLSVMQEIQKHRGLPVSTGQVLAPGESVSVTHKIDLGRK